MGPIATELTDRLWQVGSNSWRQGNPKRIGQCCLVVTQVGNGIGNWKWMTNPTSNWLQEFVTEYARTGDGFLNYISLTMFNDSSFQEKVVWMLEEAIDQAKWEGV